MKDAESKTTRIGFWSGLFIGIFVTTPMRVAPEQLWSNVKAWWSWI